MQKETKELISQSYKHLKECTKIEKMYMDYATIVVKIYGNEIYIKNIVYLNVQHEEVNEQSLRWLSNGCEAIEKQIVE